MTFWIHPSNFNNMKSPIFDVLSSHSSNPPTKILGLSRGLWLPSLCVYAREGCRPQIGGETEERTKGKEINP